MCAAQWADFAAEHKGTSYKLHVYVAWATKDLTGERKDHSMSDLSAGEYSATLVCYSITQQVCCAEQLRTA